MYAPSLPTNYTERGTLRLSSKRLIIVMNVLAVLLLLPVGWFVSQAFFALNEAARPILSFFTITPNGGFEFVVSSTLIVHLLASQVLVVILHEGVHGVFIWLYTRRRPLFGFTGLFPYAALPPGVYVWRNVFIVIALAPLVVLTLVGLLLAPVTPPVLLPTLWLFVFTNAVGAVGDLVATVWVLRYPSTALAHDVGDAMTIYAASEQS